jgi:hypothetical protein
MAEAMVQPLLFVGFAFDIRGFAPKGGHAALVAMQIEPIQQETKKSPGSCHE